MGSSTLSSPSRAKGRKPFALVILILGSLMFLSGCQSTPKSWSPLKVLRSHFDMPPPLVSCEALHEDIFYLLDFFPRIYAGWRFSIPMSKPFLIEAKLGQIPCPLAPEALAERLNLIFKEHFWDHHLEANLKPSERVSRAAAPLREESLSVNRYFQSYWLNQKEKIFVLANIPLRESSNLLTALKEPEIEENLSRAQQVYLDLRGNSGGQVRAALLLARTLAAPDEALKILKETEVTSREAVYALINRINYQNIFLPSPREPLALYKYAALLEKDHPIEEPIFSKALDVVPVISANVPLVVLINSTCASACEYLLYLLKQRTCVFTVGEPTAGAFHYSGLGLLQLENSKVMLWIPTVRTELPEGQYIEGRGFTPDHFMPLKRDTPLGDLKKAISKAAKGPISRCKTP